MDLRDRILSLFNLRDLFLKGNEIRYKESYTRMDKLKALNGSRMSLVFALIFAHLFLALHQLPAVAGHPSASTRTSHELNKVPITVEGSSAGAAGSSCFPAIGFTMPSSVPSSLTNWWCNANTEYAFVGFSYEVTACKPSAS